MSYLIPQSKFEVYWGPVLDGGFVGLELRFLAAILRSLLRIRRSLLDSVITADFVAILRTTKCLVGSGKLAQILNPPTNFWAYSGRGRFGLSVAFPVIRGKVAILADGNVLMTREDTLGEIPGPYSFESYSPRMLPVEYPQTGVW